MPNISETVHETFTKLSGFFGVIPMLLCAKYGGDLMTHFLGRGGKVEPPNDVSSLRELLFVPISPSAESL